MTKEKKNNYCQTFVFYQGQLEQLRIWKNYLLIKRFHRLHKEDGDY